MRADRKRVVLGFVLAIAITVGVVLLIGNAARFATVAGRLRHATPGWLLVCAAGEVAAYFGYAVCYRTMAALDGGPRFDLGTVIRIAGLSFGAFSLASSIGSLSVDFWALREAGETPTMASARVIGLETLRWALLSLAASAASLFALLGLGRRVGWLVCALWILVTSACFIAAVWISAPTRRARFTTMIGGRLRQALGIAVIGLVLIRRLLASPARDRFEALGGAGLFWLGEVVCAWAALRSVGTSVQLGALLIGYATGFISTGLPLPAGGSGSVDAAMTGGFVLAGASLSSALVAAIVFRLFSFWLPALGGAVSAATFRGLRGRLIDVAHRRSATGQRGVQC